MTRTTATNAAVADAATSRPRLVVVSAVGVAQILAWGASYYLPAVLARPIADRTGWPLAWVVGALSVGLLVSGLVSPRVGRVIERRGGRPVLATSAVLIACGLLAAGMSPTLPLFIASWIMIGAGMGAGLYDPAFSTLGRLYGQDARIAITHVTLFGGFASTVCWPLTAFLDAHLGWRGTCLTYAAVLAFIVAPLYLVALPREQERAVKSASSSGGRPGSIAPEHRAAFLLLAATLTLAYATMTVLGVYLVMLLQSRGLALATAVAFGTLVGPAQVGGRLLEMFFGQRRHPVWSLLVSSVLVLAGLGLLALDPGIAAAGIILYGMGSGIRSIARGTVPLAMFGREGYATLMGRLSLPTLLATAASPLIGAWLLGWAGATGTLLALCAVACLQTALALPLLPMALRGALRGGTAR